mgnify:CR=1 FL=1
MDWLPYCSSFYEHGYCLEQAKILRSGGKYLKVRVSSTMTENGKKYSKIFVVRKED